MKFRNRTALILGALALSFGELGLSAEAKTPQCTSAECACETALAKNTVEALEKFLKDHQHDAGNTACAALAVPDEAEGVEGQRAELDSSLTQQDVAE